VINVYFTALEVRSVAISVSLCMPVHLSTRVSREPHAQILPNFLHLLSVTAVQCDVRTSGFVDDVMFSDSGVYRPESKTTRMFPSVYQVLYRVPYFILINKMQSSLRAKSDVSDYILFIKME